MLDVVLLIKIMVWQDMKLGKLEFECANVGLGPCFPCKFAVQWRKLWTAGWYLVELQ